MTFMTFIIAEAGVNHNGEFDAALRLCDAAKQAGADAVKFQYFKSQILWGDDRIAHLELIDEECRELAAYCREIGIELIVTPFHAEGVEFVQSLGVKRMKIASGCINRWPILDAIAPGLPVILSTGMSRWDEIQEAVNRIDNPLTLLHCTSSYPCPPQEVNLTAMEALREFGFPVGFSDHTEDGVCAIAAAALGAVVIEKHLTLDRSQPGPDHQASIDPAAFGQMVKAIRQVERALGDGVKRVMPGEQALRKVWGRG